MQTITQSIPLNRLVHSKSNVRKTGRSNAVEALMASIEAHGLRQNLNVKPTTGNRFEVVAGGRRLEALKRLMKDGKLDAHTQIPCVVLAENDNPAEISLAENAIREAMHPDDQCSAFQQLVAGGMGIDDVAARFGVTPVIVRQRLKLAAVSPRLRGKFRKGELDLSQMMALALIDDHATQESVWADLPEWNRDAEAIRNAVAGDGVEATHRLAVFVGIEAYEAAGGGVLRDLFDEQQPAILTDAALLEQLAMLKLEEEACYVKGEGWAWVNVELKPDYSTHYARVYPGTVEGSEKDAFDVADLARAGARVVLDYQGRLTIERGLIDAATQKAEAKATAKARGDGSVVLDLNASLVEDLTAHRTAALRLAVARDPALGVRSLVHSLGLQLFYNAYQVRSCLDLAARSESLEAHVKSKSECSAHDELEHLAEGMRGNLPDDPAQFWDWCLSEPVESLGCYLAVLAGLSINAVKQRNSGDAVRRIHHADQVAGAASLDMHDIWTPQAEGFFSRLSKAQMAAYLTNEGEHQQAAVIAKVKKPESAQRTAAALLAKGWLPAPLMIGAVDDQQQHQHDDDCPDDDHDDGDDGDGMDSHSAERE
jgi:ParB family chromosome partitioning protein